MYHYNGTSWVRLTPPTPSTSATTNFHGISNNEPPTPVAHCMASSPESSSAKIDEDTKGQSSKAVRRAPLKQLFPRTPTPFKKAYAEAVRRGGQVEQIDLQKSPELFEDLKEIIFQDVKLPSRSKKSRAVSCVLPAESSASTSSSAIPATHYFHVANDDNILDTTATPSKILNDTNFQMSPPFAASIAVAGETGGALSGMDASTSANNEEPVEQRPPPEPHSAEWYQIVCGRTPAQVELTYMARELLSRVQNVQR